MSGSWSGGARIARLTRRVVEVHGMTCHLCGTECLPRSEVGHLHPLVVTLDHIVPRSRGGTDDVENLRPAHRRCNLSRGAGPARSRRPPRRPARAVDASEFFRGP